MGCGDLTLSDWIGDLCYRARGKGFDYSFFFLGLYDPLKNGVEEGSLGGVPAGANFGQFFSPPKSLVLHTVACPCFLREYIQARAQEWVVETNHCVLAPIGCSVRFFKLTYQSTKPFFSLGVTPQG